MENDLKLIYSGSLIEAEFISGVMEDNDIQFLIRNFQEESLLAGWAANVIKGEASVYVLAKDYDKAMSLMEELSHSEYETEEEQNN